MTTPDAVKHVTDITAATTTVASVAGWLPPIVTIISGIFTITWLALRIFELVAPKKFGMLRKLFDGD